MDRLLRTWAHRCFATVAYPGQATDLLQGELHHGATRPSDGLAHAGGRDNVFVAAFHES
jgi:hypothetical protein